MKITILDDYQHIVAKLKCFDVLKDQSVQILHETIKDTYQLASLLSGCEILVLTRERTEINEKLLSKLPQLKLISQTGKISNHLDLAACTKYNIAVAEGIGSPIAPSELTWILMMNAVRQIPVAIDGMKMGRWQINIGETIHGKLLGIWGYGKIGQRIAQYARAFGAKVIVWGSESSRNKAVEHGYEQAESKDHFFRSADIISLHLRLNPGTHEIVKEDDLMSMKDNSVFINTARAELVENGALIKVLNSGKKFYVGIDVYEVEPIYDKNFELLKFENVICTPHLGYVEHNSYELYFGKAFENVVNFIHGNPTNISNKEVIKSK